MNLLTVNLVVGCLGLLPMRAPAAQSTGVTPRGTPTAADVVDGSTLPRTVPWAVGERLEYDVSYGRVRAGTGLMEVRAVMPVRGRPAYHVWFQIRGGIPFFRVNDVFQSWIDTSSLASLRFLQDQDEGPKERERRYEIFPDRQVYTETAVGSGDEQRSVANPVDDGSFLYFVRTVPFEVGRTYVFNNYFRPDRNPVRIQVLRRERVQVPAGTFDALVVQPTIVNARGLFGPDGHAEVWMSDDDQRIILQVKSRVRIGSFQLALKSARRGGVNNDRTDR